MLELACAQTLNIYDLIIAGIEHDQIGGCLARTRNHRAVEYAQDVIFRCRLRDERLSAAASFANRVHDPRKFGAVKPTAITS